MSGQRQADWDPLSQEVLRDQRAAFDRLRESHALAYSEALQWSVFRHEDVVRVLRDHDTFSNAVSEHISVPNGMDPPEHTEYRRIIERYFTADRMSVFKPICRRIATDLIAGATATASTEVMSSLGQPFAARTQCAFLGWPAELADALVHWTARNQHATQHRDRSLLSELARDFEAIIDRQLDARRQSADVVKDLTTELMRETVWGRSLSNEETASILRNWTGGEVGTIAAAIGILVYFLALHEPLQRRLRTEPSLLPAAIIEILRLDGPLVLNRRLVKQPVEIAGRRIEAGERLSLMWISANRDPRVFIDPDVFRWDRDPKLNLVYGDGVHVCPGAPLAQLEMVTFLEELLSQTSIIRLVPDRLPRRASYPASGFSEVIIQIH